MGNRLMNMNIRPNHFCEQLRSFKNPKVFIKLCFLSLEPKTFSCSNLPFPDVDR